MSSEHHKTSFTLSICTWSIRSYHGGQTLSQVPFSNFDKCRDSTYIYLQATTAGETSISLKCFSSCLDFLELHRGQISSERGNDKFTSDNLFSFDQSCNFFSVSPSSFKHIQRTTGNSKVFMLPTFFLSFSSHLPSLSGPDRNYNTVRVHNDANLLHQSM